MTSKVQLRRPPRFDLRRWLLAILTLFAVVGGITRAQTTTVVVPTVALASEPLYSRNLRVKPTLTLALSVEFPTVGAAYLSGVSGSTDDWTYNDADGSDYVGYYDPKGCYTYDKVNKYFVRSGASATSHDCAGNGFSGNFMNWSSSSAIDILRYALTGGDRITDVSTQTVLQRAVLPDGSISGLPTFWNTGNFPSKHITAAQAARAIPSGMLQDYTAALPTTGVYVANCLNQIYFGIAKTGACGAAANNGIMGTSTGATTTAMTSLPSTVYNTTACAIENGICTFPDNGTYKVAYGDSSKGFVWGYFTRSLTCNNALFGDPAPNKQKQCYISKTSVTPPSTFYSNDPYFLSRVQVCDSGDAAVRTDLCLQYPSGNFKPVGNLQKYSDRVRVAVFGYLIDQTTARYGGVLRAPMKYVGPKAYDSGFNLISGANPVQEWDSTTGVVLADPSANDPNPVTPRPDPTLQISGVINYLNQFGRFGGTNGIYKRYDPVSELYYESVRYLQGLTPSNPTSTNTQISAIAGMTDAMKGGFPVYTTWDDPVPKVSGLTDYSCIGNNIVTIGDVNTHYDRYIPGNPSSPGGDPSRSVPNAPANDEPDFYNWTKVVGAFESGNGVSYVDGKGVTRTTSNPMTTNTSLWGLENQIPGDQNGYYMAGISYWSNTHDVRAAGLTGYSAGESATDASSLVKARPGMRITSYFIDVNENGNDSVGQTNHTTNAFYLAAKYGGFTDASGKGNPFLDANGNGTDANWQSPSPPNDPKTYFLGSSGSGLITALNSVFAAVLKPVGSIAGGALASTQSQANAFGVFQAKFDPSDWSGDIVDYPVTTDLNGNVTVGDDSTATWRASSTATSSTSTTGTLDATAASARNIVIGRTVPDSLNGAATDFNWTANGLEQSTKDALQTPPYTANATASDPATTGQARLNYLRGDATNQAPSGLLFRPRTHKLGDIVNSAAVYEGDPDLSITDSGYATFLSTNQGRTAAVYVGANDGMMHAFNASTGAELFAYIPSAVIPKLAALTSTSYVHTSYVDATPFVGEAYVSSAWKTVLVSGLGAGGQGVFALDVTNPSSFGAGKVMWEFKDSDDPDMGNVIGRPQIVKVRTSALGATTPSYKWFALVASGVNNNAADGNSNASSGQTGWTSDWIGAPALFLLDLSKAPATKWTEGTNYFKVKFPKADQTRANGIVGFTPVRGNANELTWLYVGDLQGRLWKLDFSKADFSSVTVPENQLAKISALKDSSGNPIPLFLATDTASVSTAKTQSISVEPALFNGPNHTLIVIFGTGRFLEQADIANAPFTTQSIYGIYDDASNNNGSTPVTTSTTDPGRGFLQAGTLSASTNVASLPAFTYGRPTSETDTTTTPPLKAGWLYDLPNSSALGERVVSSPQIVGGATVFLDSIEPPINGCALGGGGKYNLDPLTGNGYYAETSYLAGQSEIVPASITTTARDSTGSMIETTTYQPIALTSSGPVKLPKLPPTIRKFARLSWRQILNYQDLKNAP